MEPDARKVTLASIATAVGVSVSTVSNAYNRPDQLTADLRARILQTARSLGYSGPDPVARTLRRGRVGALGIIFDDPLSFAFTDPATVLTLQGVATACEGAGAGLVLIPWSADDDGEMVRTALVDGFIAYCGVEDDPRNLALLDRGIPYVTVDGHRVDGVPWVGIDDRGAAKEAAEHVLALGHRDLGVLAMPLVTDGYNGSVGDERASSTTYYTPRQRLAGYRDAVEAAGLSWSHVAVDERTPYGFEAGRRAAGVLLDRAVRPTALLAMSDELALGALEAAAQRGITVPGDLSIVGFDDTPPARRASPTLTTVHQPLEEKGAVAARILLEPTTDPQIVELPTELVVRASTGPAPTRPPSTSKG